MNPGNEKNDVKETSAVSLDGYDHLGSICSSTDCTGLIPAGLTSDAELEAYEEMYQFCAQKPAPRTVRQCPSSRQP